MVAMSELETCFEPVWPNQFCNSWWFYCPVHSLIRLLFPWVQIHAITFFTLPDTTSIPMLIHLLFPWLQCQSLKPVLSQSSQTGFMTVDDFIALYTRSNVFYSHGCNKFLWTIFTLADTIAPIFTMITEVWPHANWAVVTNNLIVII